MKGKKEAKSNESITRLSNRTINLLDSFQQMADMMGFGENVKAIRQDVLLVLNEVRRSHLDNENNSADPFIVDMAIFCGCVDAMSIMAPKLPGARQE